jgi:hypothetical protein
MRSSLFPGDEFSDAIVFKCAYNAPLKEAA